MPSQEYEHPLAKDLSVSFQRYPLPATGWVSGLPRSAGALPVLPVADRHLLLHVPRGEAVWLGVVRPVGARPWRLRLLVTSASGTRCDARTGGPPDAREEEHPDGPATRHGIAGIGRGDGTWWCLTPSPVSSEGPVTTRLDVEAWPGSARTAPAAVRVDLVDEAEFARRGGGKVDATPTESSYGGWRLP